MMAISANQNYDMEWEQALAARRGRDTLVQDVHIH
jgi:hypothetical protein